jgi:hypothetical protein
MLDAASITRPLVGFVDDDSGDFLENNMNAKLSIVLVAYLALLVSACGSGPQNLILGKWEAVSATVGGADASPEAGSAINASATEAAAISFHGG